MRIFNHVMSIVAMLCGGIMSLTAQHGPASCLMILAVWFYVHAQLDH